MEFTQNVSFITTIDTAVKAIMADGKIDKNDIPRIMLLITELITTNGSGSVTTEQLAESINSLFNYIMSHYRLFPEDQAQKAEFKKMFDVCVKLALFQPTVNKAVKKCLAFC